MRFKIFGFEITLEREEPGAFPNPYGWWECPHCMERGRFQEDHVDPGLTWFPSGIYHWEAYPEMQCACRRAYERGQK